MKRRSIFIFLSLIIFAMLWFAIQQFGRGRRSTVSARASIEQACADFLTEENFIHSCFPSSAGRQRLRVDAETFYFPKLYKCSINVSAIGAASLYIVADVFQDGKLAQARMKERTTEGYTEASGNVLGLGEEGSAFNRIRNSDELLLQKDYVYVEIMPTGGGLCPGSELLNLGRHLYERMPQLPTYHP